MSWFTDNIRNPIEAKLGIGSVTGTGQAMPAVPTANSKAGFSSVTTSPYFVPLAIVAVLALVFMLFKKG